jgi:hypothetical protein
VKQGENVGIVSTNDSTIIMAPDVVFIIIGHTSERSPGRMARR